MGRDLDREIAVLRLSRRIAAEVESGSVDEVELDDEQLRKIAEVLAAGRTRAGRTAAQAASAATTSALGRALPLAGYSMSRCS